MRNQLWISAPVAIAASVVLCSPSYAASYTPQETANMQVVVDFYKALDAANAAGTIAAQVRPIAERFIAPNYVQHRDGPPVKGNAREAFIRSAQVAPPGPPPPAMRAPGKTTALMAEGDRVIIVISRILPDANGGSREVFIFNMFRLADGKLAEHWDVLPAAMTMAPSGKPVQP